MALPTRTLKDLRRDRSGRYLYIPLLARLGAYQVPAERAPRLDRSAHVFSTVASVGMFLLIGFVPGSLVTKFVALGVGLLILGLGRQYLAIGLQRVTFAPGSLEPVSLSWTTWAARTGRNRLRVGLVVGVGSALVPLPVLATTAPLTAPWLSSLVWSLAFGFCGYASWRGLRSLP
jgi:hypothetical protein